jgi:hypothetical protein
MRWKDDASHTESLSKNGLQRSLVSVARKRVSLMFDSLVLLSSAWKR